MTDTCRKCYHIDLDKETSGVAPCVLCDSEQELDAPTSCTDWTDRKPKTYLGKIKPPKRYQYEGCKGIQHRFFAETDNEAKTTIHGIALNRYDQDYDTVIYLAEVTEPDTTKGETKDLHRVLIEYEDERDERKPQEATEDSINSVMVKTWEDIYGTYEKAKEARQDPTHQRSQSKILHLTIAARHAKGEIADYLSTIRHLSGKLDARQRKNDDLAGVISEQQEEIDRLESQRDHRAAMLIEFRNKIDGLQLDG